MRTTGHEEADGLDTGFGDREVAEDAPLGHHGDAVGDLEELLEVLADDDQAAARSSRNFAWTNWVAPTSSPRVG